MGRDCSPSPSGDIIGLVPRQMFFESLRSSTGLSESLIELEKDQTLDSRHLVLNAEGSLLHGLPRAYGCLGYLGLTSLISLSLQFLKLS